MKKKLILASHDALASGMQDALQMIIGNTPLSCIAYSLLPGHHPDEFVQAVEEEVKNDPTTEFNIVADLYGASVCTSLFRLTRYPNVHLFSGMNLNLVLSLALEYPEALTEENQAQITDDARSGIRLISYPNEPVDNEF